MNNKTYVLQVCQSAAGLMLSVINGLPLMYEIPYAWKVTDNNLI